MHNVITKDYPENRIGGIMICGINFGYSEQDEASEKAGILPTLEPLSFFSDKTINNTRFRNKVLIWLSALGLTLTNKSGEDGAFERSFFQTNWLDTQTRSTTSDGKINNELLVKESEGFVNLLEERKPSVILFFGTQLIEALNDIRIRNRVVSILGERPGNATVHYADLPSYQGTKFRMLTQEFPNTQIISLPHPSATGISNEYIAGLKSAFLDNFPLR
jgi:hypothetical protein